MKKIFSVLFIVLTINCLAQTATNFTCSDCSSINYDLFTELDAGKIIVICWVMPCGSCVSPTVTTYNTVASYQSSFPDKVFFYMADDFANTNCTDLSNWANANNIPESSFSRRFSNSAISMSDYGTFGMPKVVVLGGSSHAVFYNVNDVVNQTALTNAIDMAIASTGIYNESFSDFNSTFKIHPVPASKYINIQLHTDIKNIEEIMIYDLKGKSVFKILNSKSLLEKNIRIDVSKFAKGIYFIKIVSDKKMFSAKFIVAD